jgi:hypothetical protein
VKEKIIAGWCGVLSSAVLFGAQLALAQPSGAPSATVAVSLQINGNGTVAPNLTGQALTPGKIYSLTALPGSGWVFSNWVNNGGVVSAASRYTFRAVSNVALQANFAPNPFPSVAGNYNGLFYVTSNAAPESSGAVSIMVNNKGAYTAQLRLPGETLPFSGQFDLTGAAAKTVARPGSTPLSVQLQMGLTNNVILGSVSDGNWTAELAASRAAYSRNNPPPQAGKYTLLLPGNDSATTPVGHGYASVTVAATGQITINGALGDGTPLNASSFLAADGQWPFYASLYGGRGSVLGWMDFDTNGGIGGQVAWFRLPQGQSKFYPAGFTNNIMALGSVYHSAGTASALTFTEGQLVMTNGDLTGSLTNEIEFVPGAPASAPYLQKLTVQTSSGIFKGSVTNPVTGRRVAVNGVVLQNQNFGAGCFLGQSESGGAIVVDTGASLPDLGNGTPSADDVASNSPTSLSNRVTFTPSNTGPVVMHLPNPYAIVDQKNVASGSPARLGYWRFNAVALTNEDGVSPTLLSGVGWTQTWNGHAVSFTNPSPRTVLMYPVNKNGTNYFDPNNGTVRFWYQPNWGNGSSNEPTNRNGQTFITAQNASGGWDFGFNPSGPGTYPTNYLLTFGTSQKGGYYQPFSFASGVSGMPITFRSNVWYQFVLAYSPTNVAVYTNGVLLATAVFSPFDTNGNPNYGMGDGPLPLAPFTDPNTGMTVGNELYQYCSVYGQMTELETFNYPMTAQQVAAGFPTFPGASAASVIADSNYVGRSDLLQKLVDGSPATVVPTRLGYWRFDANGLGAEQGQVPLSSNTISFTPSWSGTALNIPANPVSEVTYWDVYTNGWANVNCRQGSLRFWFKPNALGGSRQTAPLFYMGNTTGTEVWEVSLNSTANAISLFTASNGSTTVNVRGACNLSTSNWTQVVVTYNATNSCIYTNGALAASGTGVKYWPSLASRQLGFVIGNTTAYNNAINGQYDEIETFNYVLDPVSIQQNFATVQVVDSDLNGVPDYLEDIHLPSSRPYLGMPTLVTGAVEAEQFDQGGPGVAYQNVAANPACSYRPTGMFITNCEDLGLGYCLDQTRAGEWVQYTINVLVPQVYNIEARVAGIGSNGVFECEFTNSAGFYTNTGPITIASTNWSNLAAPVFLPAGTNVMRLRFLANGTDGAHVGRFNYISIYPWWQPGFVSTYTNAIPGSALSPNNTFRDATHNAAVIQAAINSLPASGGTVLLPAGTYYVCQASPNETNGAHANAAISIYTNNIEFAGAGKTNTTLIGFNRATTILCLGVLTNSYPVQCTNIIVRDLTIESQIHLAVTNYSDGTSGTVFEQGELNPVGYTGYSVACMGDLNHRNENLVVSNCQFLYGNYALGLLYAMSNCVVTHCDFNIWGSSNVFTGLTNNYPTNTPNTINGDGGVGIFCSGAPDYNLVIVDNYYNGNTNLVRSANNPFGYVTTNTQERVGPDGFVFFQSGGNYFVARNTILNYSLEAVQISSGPSAVVGNSFATLASNPSCCAMAFNASAWDGAAGSNALNHVLSFIGNSVYGGRNGISPQGEETAPWLAYLNCSGNYFSVYPPFADRLDFPGAGVHIMKCQWTAVTGNTVGYGGHGLLFDLQCGGAVVLNNDFSNVNYRSIGLVSPVASMQSCTVMNNILGQGVNEHIELPAANSFGWFVRDNICLNGSGVAGPPFLNPQTSAVHY